MGLDVYLYHCADFDEAQRLETEYEERSEALWSEDKEYDDYSEEEKEAIRAESEKIKTKLGLIGYGEHPDKQQVNVDSPTYPDHMFKIGYWRSSYNSGGLNHVLSDAGLPDMYEMCPAADGESHDRIGYSPMDWWGCRNRIEATLKLLQESAPFRIMEVSHNEFMLGRHTFPSSEREALELFNATLSKRSDDAEFQNFSNAEGHFYLGDEPLPVVAILPGIKESLMGKLTDRGGKMPCQYVVYRDTDENRQWYQQCLEIMIETCDYCIAQPDPENYRMSWSG